MRFSWRVVKKRQKISNPMRRELLFYTNINLSAWEYGKEIQWNMKIMCTIHNVLNCSWLLPLRKVENMPFHFHLPSLAYLLIIFSIPHLYFKSGINLMMSHLSSITFKRYFIWCCLFHHSVGIWMFIASLHGKRNDR